jgi:hypothetical protein
VLGDQPNQQDQLTVDVSAAVTIRRHRTRTPQEAPVMSNHADGLRTGPLVRALNKLAENVDTANTDQGTPS